jgi:hypothetical protein
MCGKICEMNKMIKKIVKKLSKSCQKVVKKLSKVVKKLAKSWQKVSKLSICQSPDIFTMAENSKTVRERRRRRRRFGFPRPGATLSHLVKIFSKSGKSDF